MDRAVDAANLATPGVDLSLWGLFMEADIVVKIVMIGLLAASVWVWAGMAVIAERAMPAGTVIFLPAN